ncbi:efflux RND transporter periplasmic adaptor subunit, partial [Comamonadaceae bacterium OH2545_COT-014]
MTASPPSPTPPPFPSPAEPPLNAPAAMAPRRRWPAVLAALLLVAALAGLSWHLVQRAGGGGPGAQASAGAGGPPDGRRGPPGGPGGPGGVTVGTALARQGALPVVVEALGTAVPQAAVTLVPQVSGVLTQVLFTEGQMVRKGQLLARIDPRPYEQALAQARGQRAQGQAQLAAARETLKRYETLWRQDSIARQELDTQAALVRQLEAAAQSQRAAEQAAALNVAHTRITAPISGRIGLRAVDEGNLVSSGSATGIATVTQMAPMDVLFAVPQDRVPAVLAAQQTGAGFLPVAALDRERRRTLAEGRFATLDNQVDTATGTVRAKARFANADEALFPNQFVNVRLQLGAETGVLVPVTAVRTGPQGDYVYVVDADSVAHTRAVTRGLASADEVLIASGLQAGERVVTEGGDRVRDGAPVQQARPQAAAAGAAGAAGAARRGGRRA